MARHLELGSHRCKTDFAMDTIHQRFPQYDEAGQALIDKAYAIASAALADETRGNGHPFIEHPVNVALIAADDRSAGGLRGGGVPPRGDQKTSGD